MRVKKYIRGLLSVACFGATAWLASGLAQAESLPANSAQDDQFLALRTAARSDDQLGAANLAARLGDYVIPSYVAYYKIKPRIRNLVAPESEIREYLTRYDGSAIADRLRNDWLIELGKAGMWSTFDEQYPLFVLNDDTQLKCFALTSRAMKGANVADEARALLTAPKDYGQGCTSLIAALMQNRQFTDNDLWVQIRQAVESGNAAVAKRMLVSTETSAAAFQQVIDKPALTLARGPGADRASHELFLIALGQAAKSSAPLAATFLTGASARLTPAEMAQGWAQIAMPAAFKLAPEVIDYWRKTDSAPLSYEAYQWKVRSSLRAGDWALVRSTIEAMPQALRSDSAWTYWLGRAYRHEGKKEAAQQQFQSIASGYGFYGQLALEELGQKITLPAGPTPSTPGDIALMAQNAGFKRALKFYDLNLRYEGIREWNWELRKMNDRQLLAAAEFARQSDVLDRMVSTSDRTRQEIDFTQRFPAPHLEMMNANTRPLSLDTAWVYGLIRQESRFIKNARSQVGASGLMQIMPATAKFVARKIGLTEFGQGQINDINTNLLLGTSYLSMVQNDLDGSEVLATAAYNAGPGRSRTWRASLTRPVEGAIFAETIPFSETRGYVKNVMSNTIYYSVLFDNGPQSLKARLGKITPKNFAESDLP
ncbi:transglycosylase SLT domain-containing protein [Herbaspirillum sp. RTI4]|uniref:lytic transglycosylase domain-containing protein n=1 Tax=Herbaspirillum sp. RTI4 TaxID=3048640 RepID=UPI002AB52766|nr:transglycosylase SLT domain-containing protein [Herbaspirillum sp. RTI4]MDY7576918.1 transglycosylase SLT domain-containing protein [Herbaspirillum sp. RTI4]MEA9983211.1 transglycosylase SLT domain-containing protein [Herbaspirillum sp. RTI4]